MAKFKPIRIGDTVPLQQIQPATEEVDGKLYVSQSGVVLGRASTGDGPHEEILFEDLPGGGGGASYESITAGELQTLIDADGLTPGGWYLITDATGADLGFLTHAVNENSVSVVGVGGYLNADFQAVGNYDGVEAITGIAAGTRHGIWRTYFEALTINYTNLSGGAFAVGDTITGGTTGATAVITSDDGVSALIAYMTSAGVAFDGSEVLDNGDGVTADMTAIETGPTIALGDIVIWNLSHWQLTDDTVLDGTNPETNTAAYTQLLKTDADQGYITAWDVSEFDFTNNDIVYRQDSRGGLVRGTIGVQGYQFGRDACAGNNIQSPATFDIRNLIASFTNNTIYPGATVSDIITGVDTVIENNILENGASLTGITAGEECSISRNTIGQGAILGGDTTIGDIVQILNNVIYNNGTLGRIVSGPSTIIANNIIQQDGALYEINAGENCRFMTNTVNQGALLGTDFTAGYSTEVNDNILENGAQLTGITAGAGCSISRNKVGTGSVVGTGAQMADGATFADNAIQNQAYIEGFDIGENSFFISNFLGNEAGMNNMIIGADSLIEANVLSAGANLYSITAGAGCEISFNTVNQRADFGFDFFVGDGTMLQNNILENGASLTGITAGEECSISRNKVGQGAILGGTTTMGDGAEINDLDIRANKQVSNKELDAGVTFSDKIVQLTTDETETYSANVEGNRTQPGFSDIPGSIDIEGLTTLNCTGAFAQYRGIYNLTSGNATEAIDTITNPPTAFPFTIRPAAGLALTVTGTAYAGIAAGQIALKATDYILDGDKGEYIVLEIDPLGSGALIEKFVVNGLL